MATKRILLFDGIRILAHRADNTHVVAEQTFVPNPEGLATFANYLTLHRGSLFYLLTDIAEEGFQLDDIPAVHGRDRSALITRRLSQYFYSTPLTAALPLGRARTGRRDEKILFTALTRPDVLIPWLNIFRQTETILVGIYSMPLVLAANAPRWLASNEPALLITLTTSGVRQSFFDQGKLHFSRLAPLITRDPLEIARTCNSETGKTYQYLLGQRQISRETPLRTVVLVPAALRQPMQDYCRSSKDILFEFLDLATVARHEKFAMQTNESTADFLLIHLLARKAPAQQFAPAIERHFFRLWQARFTLRAAAAIVLISGLLFTAKALLDTHAKQQEINVMQAHTAATRQRYQALLDSLPQAQIAPDNLRALMARYDDLKKYSPPMEPLLRHVSHVLDDMPKIELLALDWEIITQPQKVGAGGTAPNAAGISDTTGPWVTLTLQAQLPLALAADLRAQKRLIDDFAKQLQDEQTKVRTLALPFALESAKPLKSLADADTAHGNAAPRFSLMIARPL